MPVHFSLFWKRRELRNLDFHLLFIYLIKLEGALPGSIIRVYCSWWGAKCTLGTIVIHSVKFTQSLKVSPPTLSSSNFCRALESCGSCLSACWATVRTAQYAAGASIIKFSWSWGKAWPLCRHDIYLSPVSWSPCQHIPEHIERVLYQHSRRANYRPRCYTEVKTIRQYI